MSCGDIMPSNAQGAIDKGRAFSFYLARQLKAHPDEETLLLQQVLTPFSRQQMASFTDWSSLETPEQLMTPLRALRRAVMCRLISRDIGGLADLSEVVSTITTLAEFAIQTALPVCTAAMQQYGEPIGDDSGTRQTLIVVGMGKLGGEELNASSDIDLIFIYPEAGSTNGKRSIANHEYFDQVGKKLISLLNDITPDGQVFRVDMRLRPYGDSGPLAMSFDGLENYLLTQGREWERYAWIKARVLTGDQEGLTQLVRPFVYRKYLDYNAYGAMRELSSQIRREVARRDFADNIKLGPGGIREIEFIAQVFQLIRGGREKALQLRGTRETLALLGEMRLLEPGAIAELQAAYVFLRNLEHRLQYADDQQTQNMPQAADALERLAHSMNHPDTDSFLSTWQQHRTHVTRHFEQVFFLPNESAPDHPLTGLWRDINDCDAGPQLQQMGYQHPDEVTRLLKGLAASQRYQQMALANRKKFDALLAPLIEVSSQFSNPDATLARVIALMEAISRRAPYLALLTEYPQTLQRLASLSSSSAWVSTYLTRHPILLDELLDARVLYGNPDWAALGAQLDEQLSASHGDVETQMDTLRHFQHAQVFRLVAQDLAGMWSLEALADQLSLLADRVIDATLRHTWLDLPRRHLEQPRFAVIGYGKLGGKELSYASDLDVIFVYDDPDPDAPEIYSRLARKMITWLTSSTAAGILYDIDLRLRPNGSSGLMVSSIQAFESYQDKQAWVWEHQALTRARFIAGSTEVGARFDAARAAILGVARDRTALAREVCDMRLRMLETHPADPGDVKHARGGLVDIEFIVQYLVLVHAHSMPALLANTGTIALLKLASEQGLIPADLADQVRTAYRHFRRLQHAARLNEEQRIEVTAELAADYRNARALWQVIFPD